MNDSLTLLLSPGGEADGVIAGLVDLTAAGLIREFGWVRYTAGAPVSTVTLVADGHSRDVSLEQLVTDRRIDTLRTCALAPATADSPPVDVNAEVAATRRLVSATAARAVVRIRCLLVGPEGAAPDIDTLVVEGWHNIVIAPEDSRGPAFGRIATPTTPGAPEFARYAAPVVAGLTGLWTDVPTAALDDSQKLPGSVARLARSYYRRLRTDDVEVRLRTEVLAQNGNLPLPHDQHSQVVPVQDPALASATMAQSLWGAHPGVLKGTRLPYEAHVTEEIKAWAAIKMFFGFLWASLKNAPTAWYRSLVDNVSDRIAIGVQHAVFTEAPAAYDVVVRGRRADGEHAGWADIGAATEHLWGVIGSGSQVQHGNVDLSEVWQDYAGAAFTLADAGSRGAGKGIVPIQVGAARGIITESSSIVPGPSERFADVPGVIAASVRMDGVDATDALGINDLRTRLTELQSSPDHGLQAGATLAELNSWASRNAPSFGSAVGTSLASSFTETYRYVQHMFEKLRTTAAPPDPGSSSLGLARWTQVLSLLWVVLTGVFVWLAVDGKTDWWLSVVVILGTLIVLLVALCVAFIRSQRQLFALLHQRRKVLSDRAIDDQNLQYAMADLRRLSQAYGQFLSWSRAIGSFLESPLGPDRHTPAPVLPVSWGMPMTTSVGVAQPAEEHIAQTAGYLRRDLYHPGWLTRSWEDLLVRTGTVAAGHELSAGGSTMWRDHGAGSSSSLDRWSTDMFTGRVTSSGADVVWGRAVDLLGTSMASLVPNLVGEVQIVGGRRVPVGEFLAGLDDPGSPRGAFAGDVLTDVAQSSGTGEVAVDRPQVIRSALRIICVRTQLTDGFTVDRIRRTADDAGDSRSWDATAISSPDSGTNPMAADPIAPPEFRTPDLGGGFKF